MQATGQITGELMCYPQFSKDDNLLYLLIKDTGRVNDILLKEKSIGHFKQQGGFKPRNAEYSRHRDLPSGELCVWITDQKQIGDARLGDTVTAEFDIMCVKSHSWNEQAQEVKENVIPRTYAMLKGDLKAATAGKSGSK